MRLRVLLLPVCLAVVACSGSDGGDAAPQTLAVRYQPAALTATFRGGNQTSSPSANVRVFLTPAPSGGYVNVFATPPVLATPALSSVVDRGGGVFDATVQLDPALPGGSHTGVLTLVICKDARCAAQYDLSGRELPYELTVAPPVSLNASVNGVPVVPAAGSATIRAAHGDLLRIESSEPCMFHGGDRSGAGWYQEEITETSWQARLTGGGFFYVTATTVASPVGTFEVQVVVPSPAG